MKKTIAIILFVTLNLLFVLGINAEAGQKDAAETKPTANQDYTVRAKSAVLMEATTGKILYAFNENEKYSPASVTKIMTLLLVMEALESEKINTEQSVVISSYAASMGGSQIFLEEGESMTVKDLIKSTVIASANDAAVALAEHTYGSEKMFVSKMNEKAKDLGLKNTYFENVTGLDDSTEKHLTSAKDISIMSKELIKHEMIKEYSSIWQDTVRNGEFTLTNTNRLVRYYDGCNGLKTGSTDKAGYCISATAKRDGIELICVIMGAETRDIRNAEARSLLDFGFANYTLYSSPERFLEKVPVISGEKASVDLFSAPFEAVIEKGKAENVEMVYEIPKELTAPIKKYDPIGKIIYKLDGIEIGESNIYSVVDVDAVTVPKLFVLILKGIFC